MTNGILEGFNSLFQAAKAKARVYRKTETIERHLLLLNSARRIPSTSSKKLQGTCFSKCNKYLWLRSIPNPR